MPEKQKKNYLNTPRVYIRTFGCQMNKNDSERIMAITESLGYQETTNYQQANIIILNTCSVREKAENRVYGWLGLLKKLKENNNSLKIGVCGCMPQHAKETIFKKAPHVDFIFGTNNIGNLPQILSKVESGKEKHTMEILDKHLEGPAIIPKRNSNYQAWVTIMHGCNNFCTYCVVPYTRGRETSRTKEDIFEEIKKIDNDFYKEIVLLGQNVNSYGKDRYPQYDFSDLLIGIIKLGHVEKISFLTSHPKDFSDKLIKTIAEHPQISRSIHLPIQAGSDHILKEMNRKYNVADYILLVEKIRKAIPDVSLSTDIIVGFPGEQESHFKETLELVQKINFSQANTAMYSPRPFTAAAKMPHQVPQKIKEERLQNLMSVLNQKGLN